MHGDNQGLIMSIAFYVIIAGLMVYRNLRPQKMTLTRMWVAPILFTAMTALAIWGSQQTNPAPAWAVGVALVAGLILGAPLGYLRGKHTNVRITDKPGVMY